MWTIHCLLLKELHTILSSKVIASIFVRNTCTQYKPAFSCICIEPFISGTINESVQLGQIFTITYFWMEMKVVYNIELQNYMSKFILFNKN
jgi:hypothetical protein